MKLLLSLFQITLDFKIDCVEDQYAIVEWENQRYSIIPLDLFTDPPEESDSYRLTLKRSWNGEWHLAQSEPIVLQEEDRILVVPAEANWKPNTAIDWSIEIIPNHFNPEVNAMLLD